MLSVLVLVVLGAAQTKLEQLPANLPAWMNDKVSDSLYFKSDDYNYKVYRIPKLAYDLNAVSVGHAMAYEDLITGKAAQLETKTFDRIDWVLKHPPKLMPDEAAISPTFTRSFGYLEKVFDWAHTLHAQTIDVLADAKLTDEQKDAEVERLWKFYKQSAPFTVTGLPMNMEYLWGTPYSQTFRKKYPKVNGLFWGYHWLQTAMYDMLWHTPAAMQIPQYDVVGKRYHDTELYKTDRDFMPMMAETSPRFSKRFPEIANSFDNLHMLHDIVNDVLASDGLNGKQKEQQIRLAIYKVLTSTHEGEMSGAGAELTLHDHRHPDGMQGMGMMKGSDTQTMFMSGMGWMSMTECAHCSISMPKHDPWGATVSAEGWTMQVRCLMCARDMASETVGRAIIRASTEDPKRNFVLISNDKGEWTSSMPGAVFLEVPGEHPECSGWSRAFTSQAAFALYVAKNPEFKDAKPLGLGEWSTHNLGKPDTYRKIKKPNPYRGVDDDGGAQ